MRDRCSTVSRHRRARRWPRAPPAEGVPMSAHTGIGLERCQSDNACIPLGQSAVNLAMPVCHWIRALSMLPDCCMLAFGALINAIRSMGSVSALAK